MKYLFLLLFPLLSLAVGPDAIYGANDLVKLTDVKDLKIRQLSASIAVRVPSQKKLWLTPFTEVSDGKLCKSVPYYGQSRIKDVCSGFLIAPNKLMTTLHCLEGEGVTEEEKLKSGCQKFSWMFDYFSGKTKIEKENLFTCKSIIDYRGRFGAPDYFEDDYVIIELGKKTKRLFLKISKNIKEPKKVFMMGFPMGLPMMVSEKGAVQESYGRFLFSNLDAFEGSSGSPVFNKETYELVGILNSGNSDYFHNGRCVEFETYEESEGREAFYFLQNLTL